MENRVICTSCGAEFDKNLPKCPYCGTMNYEGAEKEYFEKLENVRECLEDLREVPLEETKKEVKKHSRFIRNILLASLCIGVVLFGWITLSEKAYERDEKADFLWKSEYFPVMNELYEAGEYEELAEFYLDALAEEQPVYEWEHDAFMDMYFSVEKFYADLTAMEAGTLKDDGYVSALWNQWHLLGQFEGAHLTEAEREYFMKDVLLVEQHLKKDWGLDEETYRGFYEKTIETNGYLDFSECENYVKKWKRGM